MAPSRNMSFSFGDATISAEQLFPCQRRVTYNPADCSHWYLKQSTRPHLTSDPVERIYWNAEHALALYIVSTAGCEKLAFEWDTYASLRPPPHDSGAVAVVDGSKILLTLFRHQNVPPPMSSLVLTDPTKQTPVHVAFSSTRDVVVALMPDGAVSMWQWTFAEGNKSGVKHMGRLEDPDSDSKSRARQVALANSSKYCQDGQVDALTLYILASLPTQEQDILIMMDLNFDNDQCQLLETYRARFSFSILSIRCVKEDVVVQTADHRILSMDQKLLATFPERCSYWQPLSASQFIGLSHSGRLYANERVLATNCSSFAIGGEFLTYTTLQHQARFVLLNTLFSDRAIQGDQEGEQVYAHSLKQPNNHADERANEVQHSRRVERGSSIVTVVPSSMSLVLQMPRGNLETISPRPLVLQVVRKYIDDKSYREAFLICRRHRIDLNILCDHDPEAFREDIGVFVEQIQDTEQLNIFISGLKSVPFQGLVIGSSV